MECKCNSLHSISGTGEYTSPNYKSKKKAEAIANVESRVIAKVSAEAELKGFECPSRLCQRKVMATIVDIKSTTSSLDIFASIGAREWLYSATVKFDWKATISCFCSFSDELDHFLDDFKKAVKVRAKEVGTLADGKLNNILSCIPYIKSGDGCIGWANWMYAWLLGTKWQQKIKIKKMHIGTKPFVHQVILICFKDDGTEIVLDPWRDTDEPFWYKKDYEEHISKLKDGFNIWRY